LGRGKEVPGPRCLNRQTFCQAVRLRIKELFGGPYEQCSWRFSVRGTWLAKNPVFTGVAVIGLYGVMAYTIAQRRREIGIRMALGAEPKKVIWMVMRDVLLLVVIGLGVGVPASLALMRAVQSQLYA
jgi:hypothetical protein